MSQLGAVDGVLLGIIVWSMFDMGRMLWKWRIRSKRRRAEWLVHVQRSMDAFRPEQR